MSNLLIFVVGLAIMLLCMMRTKWGPFVCMLLASLAIGIGCGLGTDKTIASIVDGFAKTCKNIGLMVIFGTILGIYLENVPRSFTVFGFEIAFYGLIIGIGVLAGILMAVHQAKMSGENPDTIWDFAIYAVIFSVIGARIYYVVFAWDYYKDNLLSIFNTRNGGMAIYGGVIGAFLTLLIYCRIKKIEPVPAGRSVCAGLILGQIIGRWGNFMKP